MPMVTSAISTDIVATDSGHALAVWNQYDGLQIKILAAEYRPGSGWGSPIILSKRQGNSYTPRIKADSKGNAIIVWQTDQYDLGVVYYSNEIGWQNEYYLPYRCANFDIAASPDNSFLLAMSYWDGQHYIISLLRYLPGSGWTKPELVQNDTNLNAFNVTVTLGSKGDGVAAWEFGAAGTGHMVVAADYLFNFIDMVKIETETFPLYVGAGAIMSIDTGGGISLGARVPLGAFYIFRDVPLEISLEIVPGLYLFPATSPFVMGGIGVRYCF